MKGQALVDVLVSLIILSILMMIASVGSNAVKMYELTKERYLAILTYENVLHLLAASASVPAEMNGFEISLNCDHIEVGRWEFEVRGWFSELLMERLDCSDSRK